MVGTVGLDVARPGLLDRNGDHVVGAGVDDREAARLVAHDNGRLVAGELLLDDGVDDGHAGLVGG